MNIRPFRRWPALSPGSALILAALIAPPPAAADVVSSGAGGLVSRNSVTVKGSPGEAYQRFLNIGAWWDPAHTYTQDGNRLSLKAEPGGCFCESLKGGGFVEHLRVVLVMPGKLLRLQGGLGPLQEMGASGVMTVKFEPAGAQTLVTLTYAVSGYQPGDGLADVAAPVDEVLHEQLERYRKLTDGGTA
jgi:hypothetical protein